MNKYVNIIIDAYEGYSKFFVDQVLYPSWHNYFYWIVGASLLIWLAEVLFPWRKKQPAIREHFWLDAFYVFWNYFLFTLLLYNALSMVAVQGFNDFLGLFGFRNIIAFNVTTWPHWLQLVFIFVFRDFMQWAIHNMLHHVKWMWEFHKVHHSTKEMGFAALMRYHWMENIIYRTFEYIPLAMIGFSITDFFIIHIFTLVTGQLGHANLKINLGPFKYIFNGPQMHLLHHAKHMPAKHPYGFNYGITLSMWDYIFKTNYWPTDDPNLIIGLPDEDEIPENFVDQNILPFKKAFSAK